MVCFEYSFLPGGPSALDEADGGLFYGCIV